MTSSERAELVAYKMLRAKETLDDDEVRRLLGFPPRTVAAAE